MMTIVGFNFSNINLSKFIYDYFLMLLKKVLNYTKAFLSTLKFTPSYIISRLNLTRRFPLRMIRTTPLLLLLTSTIACTSILNEIEPEL